MPELPATPIPRITDWSDTDAAVSWTIDVPESGLWHATVLHSCKLENAGCQFRISCGNVTRDFVCSKW